MPDVYYNSDTWKTMRTSLGNLVGSGWFGSGALDELKKVSKNLEKAEEDIRSRDEDGVISFSHTNNESKYTALDEKFHVLYDYTSNVKSVVVDDIDQPFYKEIDSYIEAIRDLSITDYTTSNNLGITETNYVSDGSYDMYGTNMKAVTTKKKDISLDDILGGSNAMGNLVTNEWRAFQLSNPDAKDMSYSDYRNETLNSGAFDYKSIRDGQNKKEMIFNLVALGTTVVVGIFCPPAGIVLGMALAGTEIISAGTGKDIISGRELGKGERWTRGAFGVVGLVTGASALSKFSKNVTLVKGASSTKLEHLTKMAQNSSRSSFKEINEAAKQMKQLKTFDYRRVRILENSRGETLATRKEIKNYKKMWGNKGIKVVTDKKLKYLREFDEFGFLKREADGMFNYTTGEIIIRQNPTKVSLFHEGYHAEQWLDIGREAYRKLERLEKEEYVFSQIMKNQHLFDDASILHSLNYIKNLRIK